MADSLVWLCGVMQMGEWGARDPRGSLSLADSLVASPLGFTAHFSFDFLVWGKGRDGSQSNHLWQRLTTANRSAVENCKTELQNLKPRKTEAKEGQNFKTANPKVPLFILSGSATIYTNLSQIQGCPCPPPPHVGWPLGIWYFFFGQIPHHAGPFFGQIPPP